MHILSSIALVFSLSQLPICCSLWDKFRFRQTAESFVKVSPLVGDGPVLKRGAWFGYSVANMGDLNGDGTMDLAVGAYGESYLSVSNVTLSRAAGAVYILFMGQNFTVLSHERISGERGGNDPSPNKPALLSLISNDNFGFTVACPGDIDGDGVNDLAVGAPGTYVGSLYVIFMNRNGTAKAKPILIRQGHGGGPPQGYQGRFASTVAAIGDFDRDGIPDLVVTAGDAAAGSSKIYILNMLRNGTVKKYSIIGFGVGGGPSFEGNQFTNFGSAIAVLGDINNDTVTDLAISARFNQDPGGATSSGAVYICFMNANGTIKSFIKHGDVAPARLSTPNSVYLPFKPNDECGGGLDSPGDINRDAYSQRFPNNPKRSLKRNPMPDLVIGCPQGRSGFGGGRFMLGFLQGALVATGEFQSYREFDMNTGPTLRSGDQFGQAVTRYADMDGDGIVDFVVGAPGDDASLSENLTDTGAIYLVYIERIKFHEIPIDLTLFYVLISVVPGCCLLICVAACIAFCYVFRHKEDEVEKLAKEAGLGSVKLGESSRSVRASGKTSTKVLAGDGDPENPEVALDEAKESEPGGESINLSTSAKSRSSSKKSSSKKSSALVYHRQKSLVQNYSKNIDDFDEDERVDEYF